MFLYVRLTGSLPNKTIFLFSRPSQSCCGGALRCASRSVRRPSTRRHVSPKLHCIRFFLQLIKIESNFLNLRPSCVVLPIPTRPSTRRRPNTIRVRWWRTWRRRAFRTSTCRRYGVSHFSLPCVCIICCRSVMVTAPRNCQCLIFGPHPHSQYSHSRSPVDTHTHTHTHTHSHTHTDFLTLTLSLSLTHTLTHTHTRTCTHTHTHTFTHTHTHSHLHPHPHSPTPTPTHARRRSSSRPSRAWTRARCPSAPSARA